MPDQPDSSPSNQIQQNSRGDRNQTIGQVHGSIVVYVSGGQVNINSDITPGATPGIPPDITSGVHSTSTASTKSKLLQPIGSNPYKGLLAFNEEDSERYFGRSQEIQTLWTKFRDLHQSESTVRLLPVYGPSGSGKSSLVRAGLLPELGRHPLPGRDRAQVAVLVPGTQPLQSLAMGLARIAENDPTPVRKTSEFVEALSIANKNKKFDGLQRIASALPNITALPLVVLVDQFEEIYSLCTDPDEREQLITNLLYAAGDRSQYVSVILTCRSDFLGETQQNPVLNQLFSSQGFLVPIMQPEDLETAIAEPAKRAGHELDPTTVRLLVEQTRGQQGALPLLQFALQRIWDGLEHNVKPLATLEQLGGVGGALAHEAQQLYELLNEDEQKIARRIFLSLVQIEEGSKGMRRRATKAELISNESNAPQVEKIIRQFAASGVRFLVTASDEVHGETIEVAHEALIRNWEKLQEWIVECQEALRQKRKIEQEAEEWENREKLSAYLLQGRPLRDAKEYMQAHENSRETSLSSLASEFVRKSIRKQQKEILKNFSILAIFPLLGTLITVHIFLLNRASKILESKDCNRDPEVGLLLRYLILAGQKDNLEQANFCNEDLSGMSLQSAILWKANFQESLLESTSFQNAFLREANFQKSILIETDFTQAWMEGTNFQGSSLLRTNFEGATGLTEQQLEKAYLCHVKLPENFRIDPNRDCKRFGF